MSTWPTLTTYNVMPGEPVSPGASSVGQLLFDRDVCVYNKPTTFTIQETSTSSDVWPGGLSTIYKYVRMPDNIETGDLMTIWVLLWNDTAAKSAYVKLRDFVSGDMGTEEVNYNGPGFEAWHDPALPLDAAWAGTLRLIDIMMKTTAGGNCFVSAELCVGNCFFSEA